MNTFDENMELSWDSEISHEDEFILLPEGEYDFTVTKFDRSKHNGSAKIKPCLKAVVTLSVDTDKGPVEIVENFLITKSLEWKLCQFFTCLGMRKHGEPYQMNWNGIFGKKGRAKIVVNKWKNDQGEERQNNRVEKFLEPSETQSNNSGWKAGSF